MKKSKVKLVLFQAPYQTESLFHSKWFEPLISKYFDIEHYDDSQTYPSTTVFVMGCNGYLDYDRRQQFIDRRVIVDALWESNTAKWAGCFDNSNNNHVIFYGNKSNVVDSRLRFVPNWFWYNESLWYISRGYHAYIPHRTYQKKFLMPLGTNRGWRTELIDELGSRLDDAYWSYLSQGHLLPGTRTAKRVDHRWFNPQWFNDTCFSLVAESFRDPGLAVPFLTEKTYKAICGRHPFMLYAASGTLNLVQEQGFETFSNLFDESYDQHSDFSDKRKILLANIDQYQKEPYDSTTIQKVNHNHDRFFNKSYVLDGIYKDVIEPMIEWVETRY